MSQVPAAPGVAPIFTPPSSDPAPLRATWAANKMRLGAPSFHHFVFGTRSHRRYLWLALILSTIQFVAFKMCYPFPDFISDSYNYIESANYHLNTNLWPVGYAKILSFVHLISPSDLLLVAIQYVFLQVSLLYFFFSVKYLYRPAESVVRFLFFAIICNPIFVYLSNAVLSDAIFTGLTVVWFTLLLWQLQFPSRISLLIQLLIMGLTFTLRYTAMYYPIIAALAILFISIRPIEKIAWIIAPFLLFIPFILFTQAETKKVTGTAEFSVFGDWQVANNALYMYGHIQVPPNDLPPETRALDHMVKKYYAGAPPGYFNFDDFPGTFFIKHAESPLKVYMWRNYYKEHLKDPGLLAWGRVSPIYKRYGSWLITHHPIAFAQYYLLLNSKNYFDPYLEKFGNYNLESDSVWTQAADWFHWPSPRVRSLSTSLPGVVFWVYPPLFMVLNLYFAGCLLWLWGTRKFRLLDPVFQRALLLLAGFLVVNFGFSVLATPVVLRYQLVPMLFLFTFSIFLLEFTDKDRLSRSPST